MNSKKKITKIAITGGPCAGKSTALSWIQSCFSKLGYAVLFISETATELITGGVAPWSCNTVNDYQAIQLMLQMDKEKAFEEAALVMPENKILIVCDRGALDGKAYMGEIAFQEMITKLGFNEVELRDGYDAVFHLVTAAKGAKSFYTTENNSARKETAEDAASIDDKLISVWTGHPHFRVIPNVENFDRKMKKLVDEIASYLGEPNPYEIERKFLIKYPDIEWLDNHPFSQRVEIIQTYLKNDDDEEVRIRQRGIDGHYTYIQTKKTKINELKRCETERRLSKSEYLNLLMNADPSKRQIRKTRYCLTYDNQYFEIDLYPFWNDKAILEIELTEENQQIKFPKELEIIEEVTDNKLYKNSSLAKIM